MICPVGVSYSDSVRRKFKPKEGVKMARRKKGSPGRDPKRYKGYFTRRDSSTGGLVSSYRDRFRNISSEERVHRKYHRIMNEIYDRNRDSYANVFEERRELIESLKI
jgi:predicted aminopeptidase